MATMRPITDDDFDENGILRDGRRYRVPMMMADARRSVVVDANGTTIGLLQPGPIYSADDATRTAQHDAKAKAYAEYDRRQASAYRTPVVDATGEGDQEGAVCTVRNAEYPDDQGAPGHLRMRGGRLVCVPDNSRSRADASTMDAREIAYRAYDEEISSRWRTAR